MSPTPLDPLDSLLHLEHTFYTEGLSHPPPPDSVPTGRTLGFSSAHPLTTQLEFYRGAATTLLSLHSTFPTLLPPKSISAAHKLLSRCLPPLHTLGNSPHIDFNAHATAMRNLFIQMIAFARMPRLRFALPAAPAAPAAHAAPHLDF